MKHALVILGQPRIHQVADEPFDTAEPLAWIDCGDDVTPETHRLGAEGIEPIPAPDPPAPKVPAAVSNFQARAVLRSAGLFAAVNDYVYATEDPIVIDAWEYGIEVLRASPMTEAIRQHLALSEAQMDDLFIQAALIVV